jgi:hypothetical protein
MVRALRAPLFPDASFQAPTPKKIMNDRTVVLLRLRDLREFDRFLRVFSIFYLIEIK